MRSTRPRHNSSNWSSRRCAARTCSSLVLTTRRRPTRARRRIVANTINGIRLRNLGPLTANRYYDDKAWLALALRRAGALSQVPMPTVLPRLEHNIVDGIDSLTGVLPWRTGETFYNVPSNGPAAIMMARTGRLGQARTIVEWIHGNLINDDGLVMDGIRMRMHGPELVENLHPYCQGVTLGANLEIALALREKAGFAHADGILDMADADAVDELMHVSEGDAEQMARRLAAEEGIFAGISSGGAGWVAQQVAAQEEGATVVFVVCDRGDRYLSTGVFPA